jgi:hypothetical protein
MGQDNGRGLFMVWGLQGISFLTKQVMSLYTLLPINLDLLIQRISIMLAIIYTIIRIYAFILDRFTKKKGKEID